VQKAEISFQESRSIFEMTEKKARKRIKRELPPVGTVLRGKFFGDPFQAKIVKDKARSDGKAVAFDGEIYPSMSAAARAITKQETNGWRFWRF
jgi:hypothetical protein